MIRVRLSLLALALVQIAPLLAAEPIIGRATVIDADTIEIRGQRIRLHGIDAPESRQLCKLDGKPWRCGKDAAFALADKIGAANVRCVPRGRDKYRRVIAVCWLGDEDLNDWLVRNGWALAYRRYSKDYVGAEDETREQKRGIWRGVFDQPWEWRKKQRKRQ